MDVMTIATSMLERGFEEVNICKWKQANEDFTDIAMDNAEVEKLAKEEK